VTEVSPPNVRSTSELFLLSGDNPTKGEAMSISQLPTNAVPSVASPRHVLRGTRSERCFVAEDGSCYIGIDDETEAGAIVRALYRLAAENPDGYRLTDWIERLAQRFEHLNELIDEECYS
jgi:hypothetical protein